MEICKLDYASIKRMYFDVEMPDGSKVKLRKASKSVLDSITALARKEQNGFDTETEETELKIDVALNLLNFNVDGKKFLEDDLHYIISNTGETFEITPIMVAENLIPAYMKWFKELIQNPN